MAQVTNAIIDQGTDVLLEFVIRDENGLTLDLSSHVGASKMRRHHTSINSYSFTVNTYANGLMTLSMPSSLTANIEEGYYVYDVELTSPSNVVSRPIEGKVRVKPGVTY